MKRNIHSHIARTSGIVFLILLGIVAVSWRSFTTLTREFNAIYSDNLEAAVQLATAQDAMWQLRYGLSQSLSVDAPARAAIRAAESNWYSIIDDNLARYKSGQRTPEELAAARDWDDAFSKYRAARPKWFELYEAGKVEEAAAFRAKTTFPFGSASVKALGEMTKLQRKAGADRKVSVMKTLSATKTILAVASALAVLLGLMMSLIIRGMLREAVAAISQVSESVRTVGSSADAVSAVGRELGLAIAEEGANLARTTARGNDVKLVVRASAGKLAEALKATQSVDASVHKADGSLDGMKAAMQGIERSGNEIAKIISVIDGIAFQTNILALNAAVEAARAGEAGQGFAVVADEVRNLAQRSANAARDTTGLIDQSRQNIKAGAAQLEQVSGSMSLITQSSARVRGLIEEVNHFGEEQVVSIEEIAEAIQTVQKLADRNGDLAREAISAAEETTSKVASIQSSLATAERLFNNKAIGDHLSMSTKERITLS